MAKNKEAQAKLLSTLALLNKTMEQVDVLIMCDKDARYSHWKNTLYTLAEDLEDKLAEDML